MDGNIRIAKELVRIARILVAADIDDDVKKFFENVKTAISGVEDVTQTYITKIIEEEDKYIAIIHPTTKKYTGSIPILMVRVEVEKDSRKARVWLLKLMNEQLEPNNENVLRPVGNAPLQSFNEAVETASGYVDNYLKDVVFHGKLHGLFSSIYMGIRDFKDIMSVAFSNGKVKDQGTLIKLNKQINEIKTELQSFIDLSNEMKNAGFEVPKFNHNDHFNDPGMTKLWVNNMIALLDNATVEGDALS